MVHYFLDRRYLHEVYVRIGLRGAGQGMQMGWQVFLLAGFTFRSTAQHATVYLDKWVGTLIVRVLGSRKGRDPRDQKTKLMISKNYFRYFMSKK